MRVEAFAVEELRPDADAWTRRLAEIQGVLISLLEQAHGPRSCQQHLERLKATRPWIFLSRQIVDDQILGVSYVHRSGKRGATAVRPDVRRMGVGRALVQASLSSLPDQWAEVSQDAWRQRRNLLAAGFAALLDKDSLEALLGPLLVGQVLQYDQSQIRLSYLRRVARLDDEARWFEVFVHGRPRPRERNNGTYYF